MRLRPPAPDAPWNHWVSAALVGWLHVWWIKTVLTIQSILPMRAVLVAGAAAVFGLMALANLTTSESPVAWTDHALAMRAPAVAPIASSFALVSRVDDFSR